MPRNRQDVEREIKVAEIRRAAVDLLRDGGYPALSHSAVAKALGLARAAIYWYFPTKDDLFAAAMADVYAQDLGTPPDDPDVMARLRWAVERLTVLQPLTHALHERARQSEVAAELEAALQETLCSRLRDLLAPHVPPDRLDQVATAIIVFVEGLLTQPRSTDERLGLLEFLVTELTRA
ncbi:TetR/AcrR family transcriptional regulator [Actinomadura sp. NTSP31]|uniref:TetR/AcrR family transcriptional regulator n=1 Tax=Actinomadura sp. NTSP31 TaxID=1735447 RepID=UPI0035BEFBAC